jgi:hypothetical protein
MATSFGKGSRCEADNELSVRREPNCYHCRIKPNESRKTQLYFWQRIFSLG